MTTTISGLTAAPTPLTGNEVLAADVTSGGQTGKISTGAVAKLAELYAAADLGAWPERFDATGTHFSTQGVGAPLTTWFAPPIAVAAAYGPVAEFTGSGIVYTRGATTAGGTRIWEVEAEIEQVSAGAGENPAARVGLYSMKADYTQATTPVAMSGLTATAAGTVTTIKARFAAAAASGVLAWGTPAEAVFLRPFTEVNRKADNSGAAAASVAHVRRLKLRDVTDIQSTEDRVGSLETGGETVATPAIVAGVLTLDLANNQRNFKVTLNANITNIVFANVPAGPNEFSWSLRFVGAGAARTVAWPAAVKHAGGTAPSINATSGKVTRFTMITEDGGATIANFKAGEV